MSIEERITAMQAEIEALRRCVEELEQMPADMLQALQQAMAEAPPFGRPTE